MANSFKVVMQVGAMQHGSFKTVINRSQGELNKLGSSISNLKAEASSIKKFKMNEADVIKSRKAYEEARKEVVRLTKEIANAEKPTKQMQKNLSTAKNKVDRLSTALAKKRERLEQSRRSLNSFGLANKDLSKENERVAISIDKLTGRYKKLNAAIVAQNENRAKQNELRGQLFDVAAIGALAATPIKIAAEFEQSIAKLGAITRNSKDSEGLKLLEKRARELGLETEFRATSVAEAMTFLGMAGFETSDIIKSIPGVLDLALASSAGLQETANIASNILSGFGKDSDEMEGVVDVLADTMRRSNVDLLQLGETMKTAAPVANSLGIEIEEVAALAGKLGDSGLQASVAGTILKNIMKGFAAPTTRGAKALKDLNIEVENSEGKMRNLGAIFQDFLVATQGYDDLQTTEYVKNIFGDEALAGALTLTSGDTLESFSELLDHLSKADINNVGKTMREQMSNTTQKAVVRLSSAVDNLSISVGSLLLPSVALVAVGFAKVVGNITIFADTFPIATKVVVGLTVGLIALRAVTVASMFTYTFLKGAVLSLKTAYLFLNSGVIFTKLNMIRLGIVSTALAAKTAVATAATWAFNVALNANPIGLVIGLVAGLVAVGALVVNNWETVKTFFVNFWESLKKSTKGAVGFLLKAIYLLLNPFELLKKVVTTVGGVIFGNEQTKDVPTQGTKNTIKRVALGSAVVASTSFASPETASLPENIQPATRVHNTQNLAIDAPMTINTTAGMNAEDVSRAVRQELENAMIRAREDSRRNNFDEI